MYGQSILTALKQLPSDRSAAAMLRHSKREALHSNVDPTTALLTAEGMDFAREFGHALHGFDRIRLFHSPVPRCRQTAECIAEGANSNGIPCSLVGTREALGFGYTHDMPAACSRYFEIGDHFVSEWFSGQVASTIITPPAKVAQNTLDYLLPLLSENDGPGRRLDLHVSHDWNLLVMREMLFGLRHEEAGWLDFLDGVTFSLSGPQRASAHYGLHAVEHTLPWATFHERTAPTVRSS